ncbi:MAG TPA: AsnC family transcriptional regulator, partial [Paludibacter sp.]|nr:AsnC family transcriptional regulator [Paludibacter sp.]
MEKYQIDDLDKKILQMIVQDARIPFLEVARECNVSGAAIHQRIQKLRSNGIIKGSEFIIDNYKVGYQT